MKESAGTLLFRRGDDGIEVLLAHSSGPYNRRAPWGIPKGLPNAGEDLESAARRETREETGVEAPRELVWRTFEDPVLLGLVEDLVVEALVHDQGLVL